MVMGEGPAWPIQCQAVSPGRRVRPALNIVSLQTFELTKPEPKPRKAPKPKPTKAPKPRKPKARKPRVPTKTTEERIESRREYDRTRRQTDERKEFQRLYKQKVRQERKAAGICRQCSNKAITGQIRCEVCRDKHNRNG